jgi:hypothetical protein
VAVRLPSLPVRAGFQPPGESVTARAAFIILQHASMMELFSAGLEATAHWQAGMLAATVATRRFHSAFVFAKLAPP